MSSARAQRIAFPALVLLSIKKALSGEGATLTWAEGTGRVYVADAGKKISILQPERHEMGLDLGSPIS